MNRYIRTHGERARDVMIWMTIIGSVNENEFLEEYIVIERARGGIYADLSASPQTQIIPPYHHMSKEYNSFTVNTE